MIHPSYSELMNVINNDVEPGEQTPVQSRYSIVIATSKRARQLIAGAPAYIKDTKGKKPLSIAVEELYEGKIRITGDGGDDPEDNA